MKFSSVAKKLMAVTLAAAVAVGAVAAAPAQTASAAKKAKAKSYTSRVYFAGIQGKNTWVWLAGDGKTAKSVTKTVKITKGKKTTVSLTVTNTTKKKIEGATVFTVDLVNLLKDYKVKKVKISNLKVTADGKQKPAKVVSGQFEPRQNPNNFRVSIYNNVGTDGDNSKSKNKSKNYAFKKKLTVSFTVVAK